MEAVTLPPVPILVSKPLPEWINCMLLITPEKGVAVACFNTRLVTKKDRLVAFEQLMRHYSELRESLPCQQGWFYLLNDEPEGWFPVRAKLKGQKLLIG